MQPPPPSVGTLPILAASRRGSLHTPTDGEGDEADEQGVSFHDYHRTIIAYHGTTPPSDSGSEALKLAGMVKNRELQHINETSMQPPPPSVGTLPILAASRRGSLHTPTDGDGDEGAE
jgi:hypothetical protein